MSRIVMLNRDLHQAPSYELPDGFSLRPFRFGDERTWSEIETAAGDFASVEDGIIRYESEFRPRESEFCDRCLFLQNSSGEPIGTATAWCDTELQNRLIGRIHFVAIIPEYQGKGLAKPMISAAIAKLSEEFGEAYLTSQSDKLRAIKIYSEFGFLPSIASDEDKRIWNEIYRDISLLGNRI